MLHGSVYNSLSGEMCAQRPQTHIQHEITCSNGRETDDGLPSLGRRGKGREREQTREKEKDMEDRDKGKAGKAMAPGDVYPGPDVEDQDKIRARST